MKLQESVRSIVKGNRSVRALRDVLVALSEAGAEMVETRSIGVRDEEYTSAISDGEMEKFEEMRKVVVSRASATERQATAEAHGIDVEALVSGSVPPRSLALILNRIGLFRSEQARDESFCDLGSGDGIVCGAATLMSPWKNVTGYEVIPTLHQRSVALREFLHPTTSTLDMHLKDIREAKWEDDATVCFANSVCFDGELMRSISEKAGLMQPGSIFVSCGKPILSEHFVTIDSFRLPANGLGAFGEPLDDESEVEVEVVEAEDEEEKADGLFTFTIQQKVGGKQGLKILRAASHTDVHEMLEDAGVADALLEWAKNSSSGRSIEGRAMAAMALSFMIRSETTLRSLAEEAIQLTIDLVDECESSEVLSAACALILTETCTTPFGKACLKRAHRSERMLQVMRAKHPKVWELLE
eukprot:g745.t1